MKCIQCLKWKERLSSTLINPSFFFLFPGPQDREEAPRPQARPERRQGARHHQGEQEEEGGKRAQAQQARQGALRGREGQAHHQGRRVMWFSLHFFAGQ